MRTPCGVEHHGAVHVRQLHSLKTDERLAPSPLPPEIGAPTHPGPEILKFRSIVARSKLAIGAQVTRREGPASLMRQFRTRRGKRGGGIDEIRAYRWRPSSSRRQSPRCQGASTRGLAFLRPRKLTRMDKTGQDRACYRHACLKYVDQDYLANTSLRERFKM